MPWFDSFISPWVSILSCSFLFYCLIFAVYGQLGESQKSHCSILDLRAMQRGRAIFRQCSLSTVRHQANSLIALLLHSQLSFGLHWQLQSPSGQHRSSSEWSNVENFQWNPLLWGSNPRITRVQSCMDIHGLIFPVAIWHFCSLLLFSRYHYTLPNINCLNFANKSFKLNAKCDIAMADQANLQEFCNWIWICKGKSLRVLLWPNMAVTLSREMHLTFSCLQQYNFDKAIPMTGHEHLSIKVDISIVFFLGHTNTKDL